MSKSGYVLVKTDDSSLSGYMIHFPQEIILFLSQVDDSYQHGWLSIDVHVGKNSPFCMALARTEKSLKVVFFLENCPGTWSNTCVSTIFPLLDFLLFKTMSKIADSENLCNFSSDDRNSPQGDYFAQLHCQFVPIVEFPLFLRFLLCDDKNQNYFAFFQLR